MKAGHKIYIISGAASFSRVQCESARAVIKTQIHTMLNKRITLLKLLFRSESESNINM